MSNTQQNTTQSFVELQISAIMPHAAIDDTIGDALVFKRKYPERSFIGNAMINLIACTSICNLHDVNIPT